MDKVDTSAEAVELFIQRCWLIDPDLELTEAVLRALLSERDSLKAELEETQEEFNQHQTRLSNEFEGECWVALRAALIKSGFDDWSDPDGVTAQYAGDHIIESFDNIDHELKALRTQLAEARNAALEEAARVAQSACLVPPDGGSPTETEAQLCDEACRRIRGLKSQGQGNG